MYNFIRNRELLCYAGAVAVFKNAESCRCYSRCCHYSRDVHRDRVMTCDRATHLLSGAIQSRDVSAVSQSSNEKVCWQRAAISGQFFLQSPGESRCNCEAARNNK